MDLEILSRSESDTLAVARALGGLLRPGDVVALEGDLGAGKTVFAKGVGEALGIPAERVNSPTFTIVTEHPGTIPLHHVDAYRLASVREAEDIGLDELLADPPGVCVVEWAEKIASLLPKSRIWVRFSIPDGDGRRLAIEDADDRRLEELQSRIRPFTSGG